ncbi:hypothetical protein CSAL01_12345 [Colletotrichum salicis]|uniref:Uncharacterized protein n=1 Tax=Colletotrichum salicis TaxID=1209931 RepID=A0A135UGE7_9PEZI|nr:hypothetical protein CSAL01_12345 [Colletotrichum salicis]
MDPNYRKAETRTFHLPDGRTLSFSVFGAGAETFTTTPSPVPHAPNPTTPTSGSGAILLPRLPSSHEEASIFHQAARRHDVPIIALDRPGHAGSSFQPDRRIVDWPVDVLAFADFPLQSRGSGFWVCPGEHPPWLTPVVAWGMEMSLGRAARDEARPEKFEGIVLEDLKTRPGVDRDVLDGNVGGVRSAMLASVRDAVLPGGWGPAWDVKLVGSHWGFEIGELVVEDGEMVWWHGREDVNVPAGLVERAAECVRRAEEVVSTLGGMLRKTS